MFVKITWWEYMWGNCVVYSNDLAPFNIRSQICSIFSLWILQQSVIQQEQPKFQTSSPHGIIPLKHWSVQKLPGIFTAQSPNHLASFWGGCSQYSAIQVYSCNRVIIFRRRLQKLGGNDEQENNLIKKKRKRWRSRELTAVQDHGMLV